MQRSHVCSLHRSSSEEGMIQHAACVNRAQLLTPVSRYHIGFWTPSATAGDALGKSRLRTKLGSACTDWHDPQQR